MKLHRPKNMMSYFDSKKEFDDGELIFPPITYIEYNDEVKLLIGYTTDRNAVIINDLEISNIKNSKELMSYVVYSKGVKLYKEVGRPKSSTSIFRKPKVGDTVMCISMRYQGCVFGDLYKVNSIREERLAFEAGAEYTYEDKYFIVVDDGNFINLGIEKTIEDYTVGGNSLKIQVPHESYIPGKHSKINILDGSGSMYVGSPYYPNDSVYIGEFHYDDSGRWVKSVSEESELTQRTVKVVENILRRVRIEEEEIIPRTYKVPEKIKRSK